MNPPPKSSSLPAAIFTCAVLGISAWASAQGGPGTPAPTAVPMPPGDSPPAFDTTRSQEAVKVSAQGAFAEDRVSAGDTVEYRLRVAWSETQIPLVVLAPESLEAPGFRSAGQSAMHRKTVEAGAIRNVTEFVYKLVPKAPGSARVSPLKLRTLTGLANREEILYVPGAFIDVMPATIPLRDRGWFRGLLIAVFVAAAIWAARRAWRMLRAGRRDETPGDPDFAPALRALKGRWNTAESRAWIEEAERIGCDYLRRQAGADAPATARFDALLDLYLGQSPTKANGPEEIEGWNRLRELFRHARYAGGRKEPHELQDAYRVLKTCLHITGEEEP